MRPRIAFLIPLFPFAVACGGSANDATAPPAPDAGGPSSDAGGGTPDGAPRNDAGTDAGADADASTLPCSGVAGTFHNQSIVVDGETRYYYLYVPSTYQCKSSWPALFDFHGTCNDSFGPPEECYQLDAAVALAEKQGFLLVRPRSRFNNEGGMVNIYRWDENPGDLAKNVTFTNQLVGALEGRYNIDGTRLYAMGFSSGTNMASQFLTSGSPFHGLGIVCGGMWNDPGMPQFDATAPRIYAVDGYRDYFIDNLRNLDAALDAHAYPKDHLFYRQTNAGHDLYPWHYPELWSWLDKGTRPAAGTLATGWTQDTSFPTSETLLKASFDSHGGLVVAGAAGNFYRRAAGATTWTESAPVDATLAPHFVGMCFFPSGRGVAVGYQGTIAASNDDGQSWSLLTPVPDYSGYFSYSYLMSVACVGTGTVFGGGDWAGAKSPDGAMTWQKNPMMYDSYWGSSNSIAAGPSGTIVAGGFGSYLGRSTGADFTLQSSPSAALWWNGVAAGPSQNFWVVGDGGSIAHSADDGVSWVDQSVAKGEDLYAVSFYDERMGVAVGVHGYALVTKDGGVTWTATPTGLDAMLADVVFLSSSQALAVGEGGLVATLSL